MKTRRMSSSNMSIAVNRIGRIIGTFALVLALAGCSSGGGKWRGPEAAAPVDTEQWQYQSRAGQVLTTPHYLIHTTVKDPQVVQRLPQVMEGAYAEYRVFAGNLPESSEPMRCYVFGMRDEWADFTQKHTGADAAIYLQITRGGYTVGDWFVSYYVGGDSTYSVAAHEGWHQYVARHFKGRLPPFLEEGTACMFERVLFTGNLPRWDVTINPARTLSLRNTIERHKLWPLEKLVAMHAGDVVRLPGDRIEAFYSQSWAFARFMNEYDKGRYAGVFRQLMRDTAAGDPNDRTQSLRKQMNLWSPASVKPMLERYLGKDLSAIEAEYNTFIRQVAYEQFHRQWTDRPR
ncbi:MAG TPA: hypothetical protein VF669_09825 [Tepidisphaeraceae bacterium]